MWICLQDAFISAVQDKDDPDRLCVRARNSDHLNRLFPASEIIDTPDADYACRVLVTKTDFAQLLTKKVQAIGYTNFKNSVREGALHELYTGFWQDHWTYQQWVTGLDGDDQ